ncbi:XrtY-associated glycosyltransferase XYAG1 [Chitinophaga alhagiae]|uniref:XrtY-associated glycosyltransferase XYAG1 n=1 Tax=Chitinophaga alhagiae TaxID=2203219 RepID=UPI000E5BCB06|nr:glycosyltransferase [Chitinophaga alhagiae]
MNILFIVPSYKPAYIYGGPIVSVSRLAESLVQLGHSVTVYTTTANGAAELDVPVNKPVMVDGVRVKYFKRITKDHTHISPALWKETWATVRQYDTVHIHSWWSFLIFGASLICVLKGVKPVFSPRGMLCDYIFNNKNQLKKKILHNMLGRHLLSRTYLHVTSLVEWNDCLKINKQWRGGLIHNIVDLPVLPAAHQEDRTNDVFTIGFLSRVDPKKGLDILLRALAGVSFPYRLQIAGSGEYNYVKQLRGLISASGMEDKVEWVGWKKGDEKFDFLAGIDLFALTSHNENFAVVVVEALAVGTPVLVSEHVGLSGYVQEKRLGWLTGIQSEQEVAAQLQAAYEDHAKRQNIRQTAARIIQADFNETKLAGDYVEMYRNISDFREKKQIV